MNGISLSEIPNSTVKSTVVNTTGKHERNLCDRNEEGGFRGMNSHIWCELVTDFSRLEELSTQWQRWISDNPQVTIFQQWEWVSAFWKAHGSSLSLCSLAVHQNEKILGILPLVRRGERIEFLGSPDSDYNDLLCEEGFEAPVLETALNFLLQSPIQ